VSQARQIALGRTPRFTAEQAEIAEKSRGFFSAVSAVSVMFSRPGIKVSRLQED